LEVLPLKGVAILWKDKVRNGSITVTHGDIESGRFIYGQGTYDSINQTFQMDVASRLELQVINESIQFGAHSTILSIRTDQHAFSFYLRDVTKAYPIYIKEYEVIVTVPENASDYEQIVKTIHNQGLQTNLERLEEEPEESYETAANATRPLITPVWLGLSRDIRIFESDYRGGGESDIDRMWDNIRPRNAGERVHLEETSGTAVQYSYLLGRGLGCEHRLTRRLHNGIFPIVEAVIQDHDIHYENTAFVSFERSPLSVSTLKGTPYLKADRHGVGYMFTPEQRAEYEGLIELEPPSEEETVYYSRTIATNLSRVPRYAWFKNPFVVNIERTFDGEAGLGMFSSDRVFVVSKINGRPMPQEEVAILLSPGESAVYEFYIPHQPISRSRAIQLGLQDFTIKHRECVDFWAAKPQNTMEIKLPERRIQEMMQAGFMHLDLISYGLEPEGPLVPMIGVYTGIGSESSPIIQYLDSVGAHTNAERALQFFLDKQHESGFIQNFGGYMLETGAALWSMGEHYRYTRDEAWVDKIKPKLIKAYHFLMDWRKRNLREELRGRGYGMLEGKTADPEDHFRSYMLNGFAFVGLKRLAEMLLLSDKALSEQILEDADAMKQDIRVSLKEAIARSPVIPLGDGSWIPTCPPWAEYTGPLALYADGGSWGTHGSIAARDSLLGPLYLVIQEVLEPDEQETSFLLQFHNELFCLRNVALSQPYYSIHPWIHLKRGETKAFLKTFYNGLASLADREIYTFWEHFWHASPHKTHEEGWFLMQCRWMLYMEEGQTLKLLPGIPRAWMEHGKTISLHRAASYFGPFSMVIESNIQNGSMTATIEFYSDRLPETVEIRLPHPQGKQAWRASNGSYNPDRESVVIAVSSSITQVILEF
jgi:hypothetical protein